MRRLAQEVMEAGKPGETRFEVATPEMRVFEAAAEALSTDAGPGVAIQITDVTEHERVEAIRRDFVANVSHELKTPVGALVVLAEALAGADTEELRRRLTARMQSEAHRVAALVDDILDLSLVESEAPDMEQVDVVGVVREASRRVAVVAADAGMDISVDSPDGPIVILGDRRQLVSAIANLLDNAVKYSAFRRDPDACVWVRVSTSGPTVVVEVEDKGVGIPERHRARIFERFYRVDRAAQPVRRRHRPGARDRSSRCAQSRGSGRGRVDPGRREHLPPPPPGRGGLMLKVLLIEDEPSYVDAVEVALTREGFELRSAEDGRVGLARFREFRPDIVLLDLMLPGLGGIDVLKRIRAESEVPVIVLSAKDAEADVVSALELGADDYVTKPYSLRELVARIRAAMRRNVVVESEEVALAVGEAVLDPTRYELRIDAETFPLPRKEFEVMRMLMSRAGRIVPRGELLEEVWGFGWTDSKTLDQHIRRLRRKLERAQGAPVITTVRGVGYRLEG